MVDGEDNVVHGSGGCWLWLMVVILMVFVMVVVVMVAILVDGGVGAYSCGGGYGGNMAVVMVAFFR